MFIVIEIQRTGNQIATLVTTHETQNEAESKYHQVLAAAAVSAVPVHSAVVLSDEGWPMLNKHYIHQATEAEQTAEENEAE